MDRTNPRLAEEWRFLWLAGGWVPRGATYTVLAADRNREMSLYMISLGLLPGRHPLPVSYHGSPLAEPPNGADFLLFFSCGSAPPSGYRIVQAVEGGYVYRREGSE